MYIKYKNYEINIHKSWESFFDNLRIEQLKYILKQLPENINPERKNILRFLENDLNNIKCVIMGQDPYPALPKKINGKEVFVATGRSFEIGTLLSWDSKFAQHSLKNMIRLIYKSYYGDLISYEECKQKIREGSFSFSEPRKWYDNIESQGVLFLNKTFTCEQGKPLSHEKLWNDFSCDLISFISSKNKSIFWFLWGGEARKLKKYITNGTIFETEHPRLYSISKKDSFLNSDCFEKTKNIINWLGNETIS